MASDRQGLPGTWGTKTATARPYTGEDPDGILPRGPPKSLVPTAYPGVPHSFFDQSYRDWEQECEDAWKRIIDFTERHGQQS